MYQKEIIYLGLYKNGDRLGNAGFLKVEKRDGDGNLSLTVKNVPHFIAGKYPVRYYSGSDWKETDGITVREGCGQWEKQETDSLEQVRLQIMLPDGYWVEGTARDFTGKKTVEKAALPTADESDVQTDAQSKIRQSEPPAAVMTGIKQPEPSAAVKPENKRPEPPSAAKPENSQPEPPNSVKTEERQPEPLIVVKTENRRPEPPIVVKPENSQPEPPIAVMSENRRPEPPNTVMSENRQPESPIAVMRERKQLEPPITVTGDRRQPRPQPLMADALAIEGLKEDKWEQILDTYDNIHPYADGRVYVKLSPRDFIILSGKYQHLVNNSFLLHGFYNYRHVILGKEEDKYVLGVPGVFYEREKMVALMFGFEAFECESGEPKAGDFGYYLRQVEL